jgi:hypothetical protein
LAAPALAETEVEFGSLSICDALGADAAVAVGRDDEPDERYPGSSAELAYPHSRPYGRIPARRRERPGEHARAESWTHEEFLIACLPREVAARESYGGEARIATLLSPASLGVA